MPAPPPLPTPHDVAGHIARFLEDELAFGPAISPHLELQRDLALDSLALMSLVVVLEDRFRVVLCEEDGARVRTVADLAELVVRRMEERP